MAIGTVYSDALESQVGVNNTPAPGNLSRAKLITAPFIWTCAAEASGTTVNVAVLPKGARIISGVLAASATLANSATLAVGIAGKDNNGYYDDATAAGLKTDGSAVTVGTPVADATAAFKAAAAQGATQVPFCITSALGYGYETQKECYLTLTTGTGAVTTEVVRGHIIYALDS